MTKIQKRILFISSLTLLPVHSASWQGGTGEWDVAANWGGTVPGINDAGNMYNDGVATIRDARFLNTSDFGRVGNSAVMNITSTGSLTIGGSGLGGFEGTIWMAWVHPTTGADSSTINVDGGFFSAFQVDSGMQRAGDATAISITNGGSFSTNNLNWGRNYGVAGTQDLTISGAGSTLNVAGHLNLGAGSDDLMTLTGGATLTADQLSYASRDASVFTVGSTSSIVLGHNTHTITNGMELSSGALFTIGTTSSGGTLTLNSALDLTNGAIAYDLGSPGNNDIIDMNSNSLTVDNLELADFNFSGAELGTYTLFENASITGTIDSAIGSVSGFDAQLVQDGNNINLVLTSPIPEPTSGLLFGLGALTLISRRKR